MSLLEFAPDRGMNAVGGEVLRSCMQCGTCSAICPMSDYMDHSPRALNAMLLAGRSGDVLRSRAIWACTSCYACTVECPKQLPVTDTIYELRRASIRADLQPRRFSTPILVRRFVDLVDKRGRSNEFWVSMSLSLRTSPGLLLEYAPLGLRLLRRGRMTVRHGSLRDPGEIRRMFAALDATGGATGATSGPTDGATGGEHA